MESGEIDLLAVLSGVLTYWYSRRGNALYWKKQNEG
jgi:hypothetical protein